MLEPDLNVGLPSNASPNKNNSSVLSVKQNDQFASRDELFSKLKTKNNVNLVYPKNLEEIDHWLCFRVNRHTLLKKDDYDKKRDITRIFLPVPNNIGTQYSHDYSAQGIGAAGAAGAAAVQGYQGGGIESLITQASNIDRNDIASLALSEAMRDPAAVGIVVGGSIGGSSALGAILGKIGGDAVTGAVGAIGKARNPYMALLYTSPQLRTHQFQWKFVPKSAAEQETIQNIITAFKYYGAPSLGSGGGLSQHLFDYPEQFDIDFHYDQYLYNIGSSVLSAFDVGYHGEGTPMYHDLDGTKAPVSITVSATFQEVSIVTKETIEKQNR